MINASLPFFFIFILVFCMVMYVVLDGFTLGTAILFFSMSTEERNIASSMILPTWDGNQTWLVLSMAILYGAFPSAFSLLLPKLYTPLFIMVIALLFRGISFEFRLKNTYHQKRWDVTFILSSATTALTQGIIIGSFVQGFPTNYLNAFSLLAGIGLLQLYMLLGSTRLILKTTKKLQKKNFAIARRSMMISTVFILIICFWTPLLNKHTQALWLNTSNLKILFLLPTFTTITGILTWISLIKKNTLLPYWLSVLFVLSPYAGFLINTYPYIMPYSMTFTQAASPNSTLKFLLFGTCIMIPFLLCYTAYAYHIFRGKVTDVLQY